MADQKISELPSGGNIQSADQLPIVRGGVNNRSNMTQLLLDLAAKQSTSEKGAANGYASLDGGSRIPIAQIPRKFVYNGALSDLNLGKSDGYYQFIRSAANVPSKVNLFGSDFNIMKVFQYSANNGTQIIYSADYDSTTTHVFKYIRVWEGSLFTNWFQATLTQDI